MSGALRRLSALFSTNSSKTMAEHTNGATTNGDKAVSAVSSNPNLEVCTVASGCFWGVEHIYRRTYAKRGLIDAKVGYTSGIDYESWKKQQNAGAANGSSGRTKAPTYREVCTGRTEMAEAVRIEFDSSKVSYQELLEFLFRTHDPTTKDRQGNDGGSQYRSAIFANSWDQYSIALQLSKTIEDQWVKEPLEQVKKGEMSKRNLLYEKDKVSTEISMAQKWYDAEEYHQEYLDKNPSGYQCASHYVRKFPSLQKEVKPKAEGDTSVD